MRRTEGFSRLATKTDKTKTEGEVKITWLLLGHSFINTSKEETKLVANNHDDIMVALPMRSKNGIRDACSTAEIS